MLLCWLLPHEGIAWWLRIWHRWTAQIIKASKIITKRNVINYKQTHAYINYYYMQLTSPQYISITVPPLFISASHALVIDKKCITTSAGKICWDATMKYCSVLRVWLHSNIGLVSIYFAYLARTWMYLMLIYKDKCFTQALKHIDQYITSGP